MARKETKSNQDPKLIIVRERGVNAKGFGHVAKAIMTDRTVDLGSKSLYGYLSSAAGSGEESYMRRSRILSELGIGERAYNTYMSELESHGYIIRAQSRTTSGMFGTTVVEFVMIPAHLAERINAAKESETKPTMYSGTIYALGYGIMPRVVAQDTRLSYKARGLYAYYSVFANNNGEAFPSREKILKDLNISKNTYTKLLKELITFGYLTVTQTHGDDGKLGKSIVRINMNPEEVLVERAAEEKRKQEEAAASEPCPKNSTTVEDAPCPKNSTTVKAPYPKNACTAEPCPEKSTTVFNINNTIFPTNTKLSLLDRLIDRLHEQIHYDILLFAYERDPQAMVAINTMMDAIAKVLTTTNSRVQIGKQIIPTRDAREVLMQISNTATINVVERYLARTDTIRDPATYLLASIYNEIQMPTADEEEDAQ